MAKFGAIYLSFDEGLLEKDDGTDELIGVNFAGLKITTPYTKPV